jgi:hypothetical protein
MHKPIKKTLLFGGFCLPQAPSAFPIVHLPKVDIFNLKNCEKNRTAGSKE